MAHSGKAIFTIILSVGLLACDDADVSPPKGSSPSVSVTQSQPLLEEDEAAQTALLLQRIGYPDQGEKERMVFWNRSGSLNYLLVEEGLDLGGATEDHLFSFLSNTADLLRINSDDFGPRPEIFDTPDGARIYIYQQVIGDFPIDKSKIKFFFNPAGRLVSVVSTYINGARPRDGAAAALSSADVMQGELVYFVASNSDSFEAIPALKRKIFEDNEPYEILSDIETGSVLERTSLKSFADTQQIYAHAYYPYTYSRSCSNDATCQAAPALGCTNCRCETTYFDYLGDTGRCVDACGNCDANFTCVASGTFNYQCKNLYSDPAYAKRLMVGGAWTVPASQYGRHTKVGMAYDYTNDIMEYHRTALGRGWDNSANAVYTTVVDAGSNDWGDQYYGRSSADGTNVYLRGDIYTATYPDIIIAHEWGHNIS